MRRRQTRTSGVSLVELLVVCAIGAVAAGVAAPSILAAMRVAAYKSTITSTVNRLASLRAQAARGSATTFVAADIVLGHGSMEINPRHVPSPEGLETASEITFQGGTGHAWVRGANRSAAIIIANSGDPSEAFAIVVGRTSRISTLRTSARGWEEFVQ